MVFSILRPNFPATTDGFALRRVAIFNGKLQFVKCPDSLWGENIDGKFSSHPGSEPSPGRRTLQRVKNNIKKIINGEKEQRHRIKARTRVASYPVFVIACFCFLEDFFFCRVQI
ncbi:unnamed protein product [Caretta caretta]